MPADFQPLRTKLGRAKQRLDALRSAVDVYLEGSPCRIEDTQDGTSYSLRTYVDAPPDQEWAVDVAEIANHVRSVLDQLVWQLAVANGTDPTRSHTQFPIEVDHAAYAKGARPKRERLLAGVAPKHRRIIDAYQPFQASGDRTRHPLYLLNKMANAEKHRAGHVVLGTATACRAKVVSPNGEEIILSFKRAMPLGDGVDMLAVQNSPDPSAPDVHTKLELIDFEIDVGFRSDSDRVVLLADIERALLMTSQIVDRCAAKVSPER